MPRRSKAKPAREQAGEEAREEAAEAFAPEPRAAKAFQRRPLVGRAQVNALVPPALQRQNTEQTQTCVNRVVHAGGDEATVRAKLALVFRARLGQSRDVCAGFFDLVAELSAEEAEARLLALERQREDEAWAALEGCGLPVAAWAVLADRVPGLGVCRALRALITTLVLPPTPDPVRQALEKEAHLVGGPRLRPCLHLDCSRRGVLLQDADLCFEHVQSLDLSCCECSPEAVRALLLRSRVRVLSLRGTSFTTADVCSWRLAALEDLDLRGCTCCADELCAQLPRLAPELKSLRLGFFVLAEQPDEPEAVSDEVGENAPYCYWPRAARLSDAALVAYCASARLTRLELDLSCCTVGDEGVAASLALPLTQLLLWHSAHQPGQFVARISRLVQ